MLNTEHPHTILILGIRAPIALELCRSFSKKGHRVLGGDSLVFPVTRFSKYCDKYVRLPAPAIDFKGFKDALAQLVKEESIDDVIPVSEEAFYLSMVKKDLECKVWVSEISLMDQLHNKFTFLQLAASYFDVPETIPFEEFEDERNAHNYVFKPRYSRFGHRVLIDKTIDFIQREIKRPEQWIAQEKIVGKPLCTYAIFDEGQLKSIISYTPKYLYRGGASMLFEQEENKAINHRIQEFGTAINYSGQISFDFIIKNQTPFVIECNPRGTSAAHLIGNDLVDCFFSKKENSIQKDYPSKALKLPILMEKPFAFANEDFKKAKDVIYDRRDLLPTFGQMLSVVELFYQKFKTGKRLSDVMTYEFEYNGNLNKPQ